jgi:hypothetical protein
VAHSGFKISINGAPAEKFENPCPKKNIAYSAYSECSECQYLLRIASLLKTWISFDADWQLTKQASGILYFTTMSSIYVQREEIFMLHHLMHRWRLFDDSQKLRYTEICVTPNVAGALYTYFSRVSVVQ